MTDPAARRRTCLHEAGHAVADVVLGRPVEYVSIRAGRTFNGIAVTALGDRDMTGWDPFLPVSTAPPELRADVERQVISMLAGEIAAWHLGAAPNTYRPKLEADMIARQALDRLPRRIAALVVENEESVESDGDEANARGLADAFAGPVAGTLYLEWLRGEARELVERYSAAIERVADALDRTAVLQGDQLAALVFPPKPQRS